MFKVICLILVTVNAPLTKDTSIPVHTRAEIKGKVISQNALNYLVDFSEGVKGLSLIGDYSQRIVPKNQCLKIK